MARDIVANDVHVHLSDETTQKAKGDRTAQMARYFGRERPPVSIDDAQPLDGDGEDIDRATIQRKIDQARPRTR